MRPLTVLSLVIVAVAALVFALFTFQGAGSRDEIDRGVVQNSAPAKVEPKPLVPPPAQVASESETATPRSVPIVEVPETDARNEVVATNGLHKNELTGTVRDPAGNPLEGAAVKLHRQLVPANLAPLQIMMAGNTEQKPGPPAKTTQTNAEGVYRLRSLEPADDYTLVVEHPAWSRTEMTLVQVDAEGTSKRDVTMKPGHLVLGYVWDHEKAVPLAGAEIELIDMLVHNMPRLGRVPQGTYERLTTTSAADGAYRFENVTAGKQFAITCRAAGFGTETNPKLEFGAIDKPVVQDFRLRPAVTISGRVLNTDRKPVEGATIEALSFGGEKSSRGKAVSGPDGKYEVEDLLEAPYMVIASAEGYSDRRENRVQAPTYDLEFELPAQGGLRGRVLSGESGKPLTGFHIALRSIVREQGHIGRALKSQEFPSATNGEFQLLGIESGSYVIQASAPNYAKTYSEPFDVVQGELTPDVVVRMSKGGTLAGQVLDARSGKPVAGARVSTHDNNYTDNQIFMFLGGLVPRTTTEATVLTDANGRFEIAMLTPEVYQVQVDHPDFKKEIVRDLRIEDQGTTELPTTRLTIGARVRGTVYGSDGSVLEGAQVSMRGLDPENNSQLYNATTDAKGMYNLRRIAGGSYTISATSSSSAQMSNDPFRQIVEMKQSEKQIVVVEGSEYTQELYLGG